MAEYPETIINRQSTVNSKNCICHGNQSPEPDQTEKDCRLFMTIEIFGNPFSALIDTGAARSRDQPIRKSPVSRWYRGDHERKMPSSQPDREASHGT